MRIEIPNSISAKLKGAVSRGVKAVELDANGRLVFTLTDNSTVDLGGIPMLTAQSITYQAGASGTTAPTGDWSESIPETAQGAYLWTRTVLGFNDGSSVTAYSVSRMGLDGSGSVITVNGENPDEGGNVTLTASDVGAAEAQHGHELSDVAGLSDALSEKAAASHNHELSGVTGLTDALSEKAAASHSHTPASIGAASKAQYTATITATWSGASAPYTQAVAVTGILAADEPHIAPLYSADNATAILQKEAWACVGKGVATADAITFTCFEEKPATAIPIQIEVIR